MAKTKKFHFPFLHKAMGEEKPEEELMGKRKPSPRLSATRDIHVAIFIITIATCSIHQLSYLEFSIYLNECHNYLNRPISV
ncbi:hypothetical protein H1D32_15870 [Anaerobacillus sp. CMMVII]|uniref:hypothetical protein n=1 Tax=Anaerobacillus sp. CMMVII TaxID=2755588 RepID=UPI0021B7F971|nr:hypothetical protein [Anaerobacillus sp. CMMVII]MCT8139046.1 hypothetical protein [Anaerobacillus sp. CMMVII]